MPCSATASGSASAASRSETPSGRRSSSRLVRPACSRRTRPAELAALADRAAADAQRRPAGEAVLARRRSAATGRRRPRRRPSSSVTSSPTATTVPLNSWPSTRFGAAPALEHEVDVGAADAAVADLEQHVVGADLGHRVVLDLDRPVTLVDRGPHRSGRSRARPCRRSVARNLTRASSISTRSDRRQCSGGRLGVEGVGAREGPEVVERRAGRGDDGVPAAR